jgi:hypothetical protein
MSKWWRVLGEYDAETQAFSAFAGGGGASPYNPDKDAKLTGVRIIVGSQAATSLIEGVIIRMTCTKFEPNMIEFAVQGTGLRTAPGTKPPVYDYSVEQIVKSGVPITLEGRNLVATAVTVSVLVEGCFEG